MARSAAAPRAPGIAGVLRATYRSIAGKLSWTQVPATGASPGAEPAATFYGYDDAGRIERRDQRFQRLEAGAKVFTVTSTYGGDGRVLDAAYRDDYRGANGALTHTVDYDSAGRPIAIAGSLAVGGATTRYWQAASPGGTQATTGAYDALGRIGWLKADDGLVASVREYSPNNGQLRCEWKSWAGSQAVGSSCPTATPVIAGASGTTYEGTKLAGYSDPVSQTSYANSYLPSGKLSRATASPWASVGPLTQDHTYDYTFNGIGNLWSATEAANLDPRSQAAGRTRTSTVGTYEPVKASASEAKDQVAWMNHRAGVSGPAALPATGTTSYTYDLQGHLLTVVRNGVEVERLGYGPTGELMSRQAGGKFTFYVGEYMTVTASGQAGCVSTACAPQAATVASDYHVLLAGTRIASVSASRTLYTYRSRQGTVVATSLGGGVLGAQYRYDPYGKVQVALGETAANASELGYTNALRLSGNLWYLKARVYDAEGRVFLQADAVDRYRYAYVWGDPANYSDPSGLMPSGGIIQRNLDYAMALAIGAEEAERAKRWEQIQAGTAKGQASVATASENAAKDDKVGLQGEQQHDVNAEESSAVASERRVNLVAAQDRARANPSLQREVDGTTHCNQAVNQQAREVGAPRIPLADGNNQAFLANTQSTRLAQDTHNRFPGFYEEVGPEAAQALANDGFFVAAVWHNDQGVHGHIVTVRPADVPSDPALPGTGPVFNDIGRFTRVTRSAFPAGAAVHYYTPSLP